MEKAEADGGIIKGEAMERIVQLIKQYWSILSYLFFGVVTTAVNMAVYYVCYHLWGLSSDGSTILA